MIDVADDGANGRPGDEVLESRRGMDDVVAFLFFVLARSLPRIRDHLELASQLFRHPQQDPPEKKVAPF